jgi:uncharacterized protein
MPVLSFILKTILLVERTIMKTFNKIRKRLSEQKPILLKNFKVNRLGVFGSYVRGDQHQGSDLDMLIDYEDAPSLITLIELEYYLIEIIGIKVDLVTGKGLKPQLKDSIIKEVVYL